MDADESAWVPVYDTPPDVPWWGWPIVVLAGLQVGLTYLAATLAAVVSVLLLSLFAVVPFDDLREGGGWWPMTAAVAYLTGYGYFVGRWVLDRRSGPVTVEARVDALDVPAPPSRYGSLTAAGWTWRWVDRWTLLEFDAGDPVRIAYRPRSRRLVQVWRRRPADPPG